MLKNYFLITFRHLARQKGFAIINIGGLAIGMAAFVLIGLFVQSELSYDRFNRHHKEIYRVLLDAEVMGQTIVATSTPTPLGSTIVNEIPGVRTATRIDDFPRILVAHGDNQFYEDRIYLVDSTFFDVFTYEFIEGAPSTALTRPNTMVISEETARRYFGDADPIGQTITVDNRTDYEVTGIFRAVTPVSHFRPELLGSMVSSERATDGRWLNNTLFTYVLLDKGVDPESVHEMLRGIVRRSVGPELEQALGASFDQALAAGLRYDFRLEKLDDIYLRSQAVGQIDETGDIRYVYMLGVVALFVLMIACINFVNLSTARAAARAREVGLRKVLGSGREQLIQQFMGESTIVVLISMLLSLAIVATALPWFNTVAGTHLTVGPWLYGTLAAAAVLTGVVAGSYPALVLSRFRPAVVLRGTFSRSAHGSRLRSSLVVFQFVISIVLIVGTVVVFKQLQFMHEQDLGFAKEQVVVLPIETQKFADNFDTFRQEVVGRSGIVEVATANMVPGPGHTHQNTAFRGEGKGTDEVFIAALGEVSAEYVETLGLKIIAGRDFSRDREADKDAFIINEQTAAEVGWTAEEAVGKKLVQIGGNDDDSDRASTIIGVIADAHFNSLHDPIGPRIFGRRDEAQYLPVRIRPAQMDEALDALKTTWTAFEPGYPFRYFFLDQDFERFYQKEQRLMEILGYFTILAILISCLGLFGLSSFVTSQRTKEIGVRKVLGASVGSVVLLLSKDFTRLVLVASAIAFPIAYLLMHSWLEDFAYATEIGWIVFALTAAVTLLVAWSTVGWQSVRAAVSDPVRSLRYE